jgi:branched-chain amino acid transport system ATP-binding protein/branched-chain amino acid transport system permease protein
MAVILEARDVSKAFGGLRAVNGVSVAFAARQITSIVGPNGAGKTTLFNLLTGFVAPDAGRIVFEDSDITGWPPYRVAIKGLARSFQDLRVLSRMTVLENLCLARPNQAGERLLANFFSPRRVRTQEAAEHARALEALDFIRLREKADEPAHRLSYGQQKLLVIARLVAMDAEVMMLDEPTAGLDPSMIERVSDAIRRLVALGKTVVFVEHNLDVVRALSQEVVFMNEGRVLDVGPPTRVLSDRDLINVYLGLSA